MKKPYSDWLLRIPRPATTVGSFPEEPTVFLPVTYPMLAHIRGMVERMQYDVPWTGTEEEIEAARRAIRAQAWVPELTTEEVCGSDPDFYFFTYDFRESDYAVEPDFGDYGLSPDGLYTGFLTDILSGPVYHFHQLRVPFNFQRGAGCETVAIEGIAHTGEGADQYAELWINDELRDSWHFPEEDPGGPNPFSLLHDVTLSPFWLSKVEVRLYIEGTGEDPEEHNYGVVSEMTLGGPGLRPLLYGEGD